MNDAEIVELVRESSRTGLLVGLLLGVPIAFALLEVWRGFCEWWRERDRVRFIRCQKDWK